MTSHLLVYIPLGTVFKTRLYGKSLLFVIQGAIKFNFHEISRFFSLRERQQNFLKEHFKFTSLKARS